ncbi:MAG: hypothetical protein UY41_C0045G0008, partial [Candidatus Moranbacteria bacterium GW2011_GWE1_49_15]
RALVCGDIMREQLDLVLGKAFQRLDIDAISRIKVAISKILTQKTQTEEKAERMESVPIAAALKKYEKLGEQMITSGPIKLRVFPELVKPSIKNWIADYHDNLGAQKHGSIERGNYLFHSNNAKKLSSLERRRLAEILKSLDGDGEVNVDPALQKILFENKTEQDMPENSSAREKVSSTKPAMEKKVENYFSASPKPVPARQSAPQPQPAAQGAFQSGMHAPQTQSRQSFAAPARPTASTVQKNDFENKRRSNPLASLQQEAYSIPPRKQEIPNQENPRRVWNPAEAVKRRMMEESGAAQSSPAPVSNPVPAPQSVPVPGQGNSIRFSSPQTFPTEKRSDEQKKFSEHKEFYSNPASVPAAAPKTSVGSAPKIQVPSAAPKAPIKNAPSAPVQARQAFPQKPHEEDDLMERIREMKRKQQAVQPSAKPVFKITPMGFIEDKDGGDIKYDDGDVKSGPKVSGNTVDLRK